MEIQHQQHWRYSKRITEETGCISFSNHLAELLTALQLDALKLNVSKIDIK
jgi:hypothetical protein